MTIRENVVFARAGERELLCDVFTPPAEPDGAGAPRPGVLLVHGGGWRGGDKLQMRAYGIQLALEGFVCISSSYRLTPQAPWPAQIHDVKAALRYVHSHAEELGIDPRKLAAMGASAGAHLILLAAGTVGHPEFEGDGDHAGAATAVAAAVGIVSPTVLAPRGTRLSGSVPARALMEDDDEAAAALASPITHVRAGYPPTFLITGSADKLVPPSSSMRMYEALAAAGVPTELHIYPDQPHTFVAQKRFHRLTCKEISLFLQRYLGLMPHVDPSLARATD
ncbi:MAG: alpha/beta hydrolase [Myxococcales bacterium]|nr:alpha/beta hydrolase [Myxococcales bacterium]